MKSTSKFMLVITVLLLNISMSSCKKDEVIPEEYVNLIMTYSEGNVPYILTYVFDPTSNTLVFNQGIFKNGSKTIKLEKNKIYDYMVYCHDVIQPEYINTIKIDASYTLINPSEIVLNSINGVSIDNKLTVKYTINTHKK